jgi:ATP-binding cassette, subfamily B, multidrug efflux pump
MDHSEEPLDRGYDSALLRRLLGYLRPYRWHVASAVLLLLATAGLSLVGPLLTQQALDVAVPRKDLALIGTLALVFALALVVEFACEYVGSIISAFIGQRVMYDLRIQIFSHLQRISIPYFDKNPVGRLMTRVTSDVETLNELFSAGLVTVFGDVFTLVAIMVLMLVKDWRLALVAFGVIPLVFLAASIFRRSVRDAFREIRVRLARINSFLQEHLSGMRVVQLFNREPEAARQFEVINRDHLTAHLKSIRIYAVFFPVIEVLTSVAIAALLWYGGLRVLDGTLTVGILAAFIQLTRRFFQPLQDLSEKYNLLQSAMASSERIFRLLDTPASVEEAGVPRALAQPTAGVIAFEGVSFRYSEDGPWVLKDVSFTASAGRTVALVGHTGAGKTTIISLLLRFYDPTRGRITLDGVDIREISTGELRSLIGFVQQDLFLFTGDIQRNIALDAPIGQQEVTAAAERVGAGRFIERLPSRYAHVLGERGKSLSVGERQLLSFARALARDPKVLVLDEATSSVDTQSEAQIQRAISEVMAGRTSIVVAHRLSTILHADEILVLHHGEIRERGSHRELLAQNGLYQRLYRLQFEDQRPARTA